MATLLAAVFLFGVFLCTTVQSCNEAVCASVVSKCMLTQSCKCDLKKCSCCQECFTCLSYLYNECCSCVDMCPKPNATGNPLGKKSHVEDFADAIPELFEALMLEPDSLERWEVFTFPVDIDIGGYYPKLEVDIKMLTNTKNQHADSQKNIITVNCTVSYMTPCMSWQKCRASCQSTGASKYRWFHDGCCECVGQTCLNYGINESRCSACTDLVEYRGNEEEEEADYFYDDDVDYGFEDGSFQQASEIYWT